MTSAAVCTTRAAPAARDCHAPGDGDVAVAQVHAVDLPPARAKPRRDRAGDEPVGAGEEGPAQREGTQPAGNAPAGMSPG